MDCIDKIPEDTKAKLISMALEARQYAYAPYSGYAVGAALLCEDGSIYTGCNVENASFGATNCAERTAVFQAVSEGKRHFTAIAIVGGQADEKSETTSYAFPCGVCRQVLREFSKPEQMLILVGKSVHDYQEMTLAQLLPESFGPEHLEKRNSKK